MLAVTYYLFPAILLARLAAGNSVYSNAILAGLGYCEADANESWGYRGRKGPEFWGNDHPGCNGMEQSPVDINRNTAVKDENLAKLLMNNYDSPISEAKIENNGHTIELTPEDDVVRSITIGGSTYKLKQLHFHWGSTYDTGSEHTIDGKQYALEMHLVHTNENDEIAVVGVIFKEKRNDNSDLQNIVDALQYLKFKGTESPLNGDLNLNNLLPENPSSYYRYKGSLTTPGCSEGVTWTVLKHHMHVGRTQMKEFRKLYSVEEEDKAPGCRLSDNYRPIQPLNNRKVYRSQ